MERGIGGEVSEKLVLSSQCRCEESRQRPDDEAILGDCHALRARNDKEVYFFGDLVEKG
jgi:hypothetical protein